MSKKRLTELMIEQIKAPAAGQVTYWDRAVAPFGLRVGVSGRKSWVAMPRVLIEGKWKPTRIVLGHYPAMKLGEARDEAREVIKLAEDGGDPRNRRKDKKVALESRSRDSYGIMRDRFIKRYCVPNLKSADQYATALSGPPFEKWESRPITAISRQDILGLRDSIADGYTVAVKRGTKERKERRGGPVAANRTLAYLKVFFGWCVDSGYLEVSPADRVKREYRERSRERVLTDDELVAVWNASGVASGRNINTGADNKIEDDELGLYGAIVRLLILTGQRRSEVAGMPRGELDIEGKTWTIAGVRTKNGEPHVVPLASQAVGVIEKVPAVKDSSFVFTINGETSFANWTARKKALDTASGVTDWTLHDLRRTFVTGLHEKLGIEPHIVEAIVNHMSGEAKAGVAGVYNKAAYLERRRLALQAWADHVDGLLAGKPAAGGDVVNINDHRRNAG